MDSNDFIGEVVIEMSEACLDNMPHWYPLHVHDFEQMPLPTPTPMLSPKTSIKLGKEISLDLLLVLDDYF